MELISSLKSTIKEKTAKLWYRQSTYSQSGEDIILYFLLTNILKLTHFNYLDIGAHHPYRISNTALFYQNGCCGINVEPNPDLYKNFVKSRPRDINLNIGVGDESGNLDFYIMQDCALSTFSKYESEKLVADGHNIIKKISVPVESLLAIIEKYAKGKFPTVLLVDAEGVEDKIISGLESTKQRPIVICIETLEYKMDGSGVKNNALIEKIKKFGFTIYADTYINTIFVSKEHWPYAITL